MYNRYIPGADGYTRVSVREQEEQTSKPGERKRPDSGGWAHGRAGQQADRTGTGDAQDLFRRMSTSLNFFAGEDKNAGMAGILKSLHLEELDSGDVLLLLIILFLFLEGDNIELVITLGLMLLLGLGDEKAQKE